MRKSLLIASCLCVLLLIAGTGLFVSYAAKQFVRGSLFFGVSGEILANPPIASEPGITNRIAHGIDPISLLNNKPTGAANAATSYIEVVRLLAAREAQGTLEYSSPGFLTISDTEFEIFMDGVRQVNCDFSRESLILDGKPVRLAPTVDVSDTLGHLSWFRKMGGAVLARGKRHETRGETEAAVRCYEGAVKFGFDGEKGRESLIQALIGASIQKSAAQELREFFESVGDEENRQRWSDFLADLDRFVGKFKDKTKMLTKTVGLGPEAVANGLWILEHDEDHLFRREALVGLGVQKFFAPGVIIPVLGRTAVSDPDPYVREAAQNALKLAPSLSAGREENPARNPD
ncbi:MAG: HEAT repeat domain-containing protein [Candidatus Abyssubacteria bacterium]|nr:HEAT repeat domain-containing protein [Candidatus Abyssubacteria bacterium]